MDPNEALAEIREARRRIEDRYAWVAANRIEDLRQFDERNADDRMIIEAAVGALDAWLSSGGFLPDAWSAASR